MQSPGDLRVRNPLDQLHFIETVVTQALQSNLRAEAEDLASEIWLEVFEKQKTFNLALDARFIRARVIDWLRMHGHTNNHHTPRKPHSEVTRSEELGELLERGFGAHTSDSTKEWESQQERIEALHRSLSQLTFTQKRIVVLKYYLGRTHSDIALSLGIAPGTVEQHVSQLLERLRELMWKECANDRI